MSRAVTRISAVRQIQVVESLPQGHSVKDAGKHLAELFGSDLLRRLRRDQAANRVKEGHAAAKRSADPRCF